MDNMKITLYAKKRTNGQGKTFYKYLSTLTRKDGTEQPVDVKFADCEPPKPEACPCNIEFQRQSANVAVRRYTDTNTAEVKLAHTLWIKNYTYGDAYVDHSLDEFV